MEYKEKKSKKNRLLTGFTLIELLVVIAIIGILASVVFVNVNQIRNKVKIARANVDAKNIEKALLIFDIQYGDYPWSYYGHPNWTYFYSSDAGGPGEPFLNVDGQPKYLSEVYKQDWVGYNADYFVKNGFFYVYLWDNSGDGKIGCGVIELFAKYWYFYGFKYILCQDCDYCGGSYEYPFRTTSY